MAAQGTIDLQYLTNTKPPIDRHAIIPKIQGNTNINVITTLSFNRHSKYRYAEGGTALIVISTGVNAVTCVIIYMQ